MFYTILWAIMWLLLNTPALTLGSPALWALALALVVDIFLRSPYGAPWIKG